MSGGVAYVYDEDGQFASRCNTAMVTLEPVLSAAQQKATVDVGVWHRGQSDEEQLKKLLLDHSRWTGSRRARDLLENWEASLPKFVKVFPTEYKRALAEIHAKGKTDAGKGGIPDDSLVSASAAINTEVEPPKATRKTAVRRAPGQTATAKADAAKPVAAKAAAAAPKRTAKAAAKPAAVNKPVAKKAN